MPRMPTSLPGAAGTERRPPTTPARDRYPDALRAGALVVVVLGHWLATLPRMTDGRLAGTEHLLRIWDLAGLLTWVVQVVPLFVFVSAAVSADGVERRMREDGRELHWWAGRALGLARPTVTYLAVLAALALGVHLTGGRLLSTFDRSLTVHLWFLIMLLAVQALLPLSVRADRRFGPWAVLGLVALVALGDVSRAGAAGLHDARRFGAHVVEAGGGWAWINLLLAWLVPQQLGIAWKRGRFGGARSGLAFLALGAAWLLVALRLGYPAAMVGVGLAGNNMLPPTLALLGVMWLQVGAVLLFEHPARRLLEKRPLTRAVALLSALGMPLYLWHKLAEPPAAWLAERLRLPIDAGDPGDAGFWLGRLGWIALCAVVVAPVLVAVVAFERRRRVEVAATSSVPRIFAGGFALLAGLAASLALGVVPGALYGLCGAAFASWCLRAGAARDGGR